MMARSRLRQMHPSGRLAIPCVAAMAFAFAFTTTAFAQATQKRGKPGARVERDKTEIVQLEKNWLHAQNTGNTAALEKILAPDFIRPIPDSGKFITKTQIVDYFRSHPFPHHPGPQPRFARLRIRLYGDVAIARGILTASDAKGILVRKTLFTDVFVRRNGRWQAVSAQENNVPQPRAAAKTHH